MSQIAERQPIRILVVDDKLAVVDGIRRFLARQPDVLVVDSAMNGIDAIDKVAQHKPDLVLMDVHLPEMNGLEAAAGMRSRFPKIRIIMISIDQDAELRADCLQHGADSFLPKIGLQRMLMLEIKSLFAAHVA